MLSDIYIFLITHRLCGDEEIKEAWWSNDLRGQAVFGQALSNSNLQLLACIRHTRACKDASLSLGVIVNSTAYDCVHMNMPGACPSTVLSACVGLRGGSGSLTNRVDTVVADGVNFTHVDETGNGGDGVAIERANLW